MVAKPAPVIHYVLGEKSGSFSPLIATYQATLLHCLRERWRGLGFSYQRSDPKLQP